MQHRNYQLQEATKRLNSQDTCLLAMKDFSGKFARAILSLSKARKFKSRNLERPHLSLFLSLCLPHPACWFSLLKEPISNIDLSTLEITSSRPSEFKSQILDTTVNCFILTLTAEAGLNNEAWGWLRFKASVETPQALRAHNSDIMQQYLHLSTDYREHTSRELPSILLLFHMCILD